MPKAAERKESGFALFCVWLEEKLDNSNSGQSELPALRKKHEELRTVKPGVAGETARLGAAAVSQLAGKLRWACTFLVDW